MPLAELSEPQNFSLLLQLVVPGFVIAYVRAQLVANRRLPFSEAIVSYLAISFIYQALIFPLTAWLKVQNLNPMRQNLSEFLVSIVLPAALGLLIGMNARQGWSRWAFSKIGVHLNHPVNTAWDWRFVGKKECWVHVVMKDDTKWAGHLGGGSFISTDPSERDIYIENVYLVGDQDEWSPKGSAVWLPQCEIRSLEFWPMEEAPKAGAMAQTLRARPLSKIEQ
jgi:hypothetical protein